MNKLIQRKWMAAFPDFLELLAMGLSAGFVFNQAFTQAIEALGDNALLSLFATTVEDNRLNYFLELMAQLPSPRLRALALLIVQAAKRGSPLGPLLMEQAEFLREERFLDIEKRAQTAGVRLLFPIMFFIFPPFFILILGSLFLQIRQQGFLN